LEREARPKLLDLPSMKTIPPVCNEPETGPRYWRSLDQLADKPEFRHWLEQEFPAGASVAPEGESRRSWMKLMSASFLLAGLGGVAAGCRRPVAYLTPFAKQPDNYVYGGWQYFATSRPFRGGAVPLVVRSSDGRPTKIEGNPLYPDGNGGTDLQTQAALLNLYDPDRAQRHTRNGAAVKREVVADAVTGLSKKFAGNGGEGLIFLVERDNSPTRARLQERISKQWPKARWFAYEPVDFDIHRKTASVAFGGNVTPRPRYDRARRILSLDADFLGAEADAFQHIRGFAKSRTPGDSMNRLYSVETLFTLTGGQADHRLRVKPSEVIKVAAHVASFLLEGDLGLQAKRLAEGSPATALWAQKCAEDLKAAGAAALVVAGYAQPAAVHLLAHAINAALGAVGQSVELLPAAEPLYDGDIAECVAALQAGVDTLVILGGNPAYNTPADLDFAAAAAKAGMIVSLGYWEDETSMLKAKSDHWRLAAAHFLESWGDGRTSNGTVVPVQPLIEPLFGGFTVAELLARIAGEAKVTAYEVVRATFQGDEAAWKKYLHDGFLAGSEFKPASAAFAADQVAAALAKASPAKTSGYELVLHRDLKVDDGRYGNNGWLQEVPDPVTKLSWENAVVVSAKTARELGVTEKTDDGRKDSNDAAHAHDGQYNQQIVEVSVGGKSVKGPVWVQPGLADGVVALALGYGRTAIGRVGAGCGFNAYTFFKSDTRHSVSGATAKAVYAKAYLATTQEHGLMEGRPIIREANLEQAKARPDFAQHMDLDEHMREYVLHREDGSIQNIYDHPYRKNPSTKSDIHQWGMTVDLTSCVGCAACVVACQAENNIPIVGKDQIMRGREMHWIRIDRYYSHDPEKKESITHEHVAADPQMAVQPMFCQHCEAAPCESVCPVNATVHDEEGLNVMAYNRCIGTRYCANNCPFKVRRFNFFDFNKREIAYGRSEGKFLFNVEDPLYKGPLGPNKNTEPAWEIIKLVRNPDVSVRMRGVMEKCTFCVQRIEQAKIARKNLVRDSGDVAVPDGGVRTACQQACPAGAIVFGNTLDPQSAVSKLKADPRNYTVLGFLDIRPRVTYLARIRNPHPEIAAQEHRTEPDSLRDYELFRDESPFRHHGEAGGEKKGGA
jgi:MoCo/4Fe-4S cofactor protein with predicted Tat translocation signal